MAETDRKVLAICIGAAFVFWLILNLSRDYSISRTVEITYQMDPERVIAGRAPEFFDVQIQGRGWNLLWEGLRPGNLPVTIDLRGQENLRLTQNDFSLKIDRKLSSGDLSVGLMNFEPVNILTTPKEGKRVPVSPRIDVDFAPGYLAAQPGKVSPDSITISGSLDVLSDIQEWPSREVEVTAVNENLQLSLPLVEPPPGISLSRTEVAYELAVEPFIQEKIMVPVRSINAPEVDSFRIFPEEVEVVVTLPKRAYGSLRASDFLLVADLSTSSLGDRQVKIPLTLNRSPTSAIGVRFFPKAIEYSVLEKLPAN
jgi:YbbR domain-containing protein